MGDRYKHHSSEEASLANSKDLEADANLQPNLTSQAIFKLAALHMTSRKAYKSMNQGARTLISNPVVV